MNIIIIGFKKSGKTTLGKVLASLLNKEFVDIDEIIKKIYQSNYKKSKNVFEIFEILKEKKFREIESQAFKIIRDIESAVISTSGGSILNDVNLSIIKDPKKIIYLQSSKKILIERIQKLEDSIFKDLNFFNKEYEKRKILYKSASDFIFETDDEDFEKISIQIKDKLHV